MWCNRSIGSTPVARSRRRRVLANKHVAALVQINVSRTERNGIAPDDAAALAACLRADEGLEIDGVMAIGPRYRRSRGDRSRFR